MVATPGKGYSCCAIRRDARVRKQLTPSNPKGVLAFDPPSNPLRPLPRRGEGKGVLATGGCNELGTLVDWLLRHPSSGEAIHPPIATVAPVRYTLA